MLNVEFTGGQVLGGIGLEPRALAIGDGRIVERAATSVDLSGFKILPGIVDVHGDGFERHVAPRRGAMKQMHDGLRAAEAELAANGITTGVFAQFLSWEGGVRGPEFADQVFAALKDVRADTVTDLRPQLRFETHMLEEYPTLAARIAAWGISYVVFNDHLPHDRLADGRTPKRVTAQALKARRNPAVHLAMMQEMHARRDEVPAALDALCATLAAQGVAMGSHDDTTQAQRAGWRARGVTVAEFPETLEAAEAAKSAGDHVVLGAPNVVRGGSHNGNVSALDLIMMGYCDAIASDYHYPSPRRAALMLARSGAVNLAQAWHLISAGPAQLLGLTDRGRCDVGLRADLVILDENDRVAATLCEGRISHMSGEIANRFVAAV